MNVAELIEHLKAFDQSLPVVTYYSEYSMYEPNENPEKIKVGLRDLGGGTIRWENYSPDLKVGGENIHHEFFEAVRI